MNTIPTPHRPGAIHGARGGASASSAPAAILPAQRKFGSAFGAGAINRYFGVLNNTPASVPKDEQTEDATYFVDGDDDFLEGIELIGEEWDGINMADYGLDTRQIIPNRPRSNIRAFHTQTRLAPCFLRAGTGEQSHTLWHTNKYPVKLRISTDPLNSYFQVAVGFEENSTAQTEEAKFGWACATFELSYQGTDNLNREPFSSFTSQYRETAMPAEPITFSEQLIDVKHLTLEEDCLLTEVQKCLWIEDRQQYGCLEWSFKSYTWFDTTPELDNEAQDVLDKFVSLLKSGQLRVVFAESKRRRNVTQNWRMLAATPCPTPQTWFYALKPWNKRVKRDYDHKIPLRSDIEIPLVTTTTRINRIGC
jgi:hypothetical protein